MTDYTDLAGYRLAELLEPDGILLNITATSKQQLFEQLAARLARHCELDAKLIFKRLWLRERAGSTAMGHGFALPHARLAELKSMHALYVTLAQPVDFAEPAHAMVDQLIVLLVPEPAIQAHLELLAQITSLFTQAGFRRSLKHCRQPQQVFELMTHTDFNH